MSRASASRARMRASASRISSVMVILTMFLLPQFRIEADRHQPADALPEEPRPPTTATDATAEVPPAIPDVPPRPPEPTHHMSSQTAAIEPAKTAKATAKNAVASSASSVGSHPSVSLTVSTGTTTTHMPIRPPAAACRLRIGGLLLQGGTDDLSDLMPAACGAVLVLLAHPVGLMLVVVGDMPLLHLDQCVQSPQQFGEPPLPRIHRRALDGEGEIDPAPAGQIVGVLLQNIDVYIRLRPQALEVAHGCLSRVWW